jgi:hypothetical protein
MNPEFFTVVFSVRSKNKQFEVVVNLKFSFFSTHPQAGVRAWGGRVTSSGQVRLLLCRPPDHR